jgi:hypothetical protein
MREILFWGTHATGATMVGGERKIFENMEPLDRCKRERSKKKFLHVNLLTFITSVLCPQVCKILHF